MAKNYEYKKATIADIDELVRTRIIVLRTANKLSNDVDMSLVEKESYEYYKNALETGEHIAYLVYDNETFIGAGGVSFYRVMPTYHNPTGKKAYIMNMYTYLNFRKTPGKYEVHELWSDEWFNDNTINATVPHHGVKVYRIHNS